jgi:hypothetical protein
MVDDGERGDLAECDLFLFLLLLSCSPFPSLLDFLACLHTCLVSGSMFCLLNFLLEFLFVLDFLAFPYLIAVRPASWNIFATTLRLLY